MIFIKASFPKRENCFGLISIWCVDNTYRPPVVRNRELKYALCLKGCLKYSSEVVSTNFEAFYYSLD